MRNIQQVHNAVYAPIADLVTYRALPTDALEQIDPFLFLNHHGPQTYPPRNHGLPFGPHPHRGMETVTFILAGDIMHKDSAGHESVITAGGVQWMTAGRGLIHAETSSAAFKQQGGDLEILQLWLNLPATLKMTEPRYIGLPQEQIPEIKLDDDKVMVQLVAGNWDNTKAAFESVTGVQLNIISFKPGGKISIPVPIGHAIFFYVIKGRLTVNNTVAAMRQLVEFNGEKGDVQVEAMEESTLLFGHARPLNEPVVAHGPFVMNTALEIQEAYNDYRLGKFGVWH